ncbi:putative EF-Hand 1, calcium-binding protein [Helianthus annuus]|uniref:EF-Hand 1, calcium-binding protein n=1 Tax=Helianthus annuus TaxID=4232 RepID=A0A9K3J4W6_HELAN|nr:putative EF-Hand 1, calcium-binding protein [Helianthus annuus]KAJ0579893.1 putative EF-Hand 1, calcium-binding protein [Helianthus annuus]KAJ0587221.1 putative EF-Hand 1, calcium-binding, Two pore domain potassium channel, plant [Helianthus annuus]KAJ0756465.1 putative EF-Hand 1, calcium-binding protein [Helianthus annuus]KAJ0760223.1 putative EF-Hand 1, calcium-binding protein [Helianthus annuus]
MMTSAGYGDVIPDSALTILLACLFVVLGMLIVGLVLGKAAEVLVVKQERILEKDLDFVHAFYYVVATLTGLDYIHTCFSITGSAIAVHFRFAVTERKQRSLVKWVLKRNTTSDLEAADFDGDGVVAAAEFVLYKLKVMGKISQDDIT